MGEMRTSKLRGKNRRAYTDYADLVIEDRYIVCIDPIDYSWEVLDLDLCVNTAPTTVGEGGASSEQDAIVYSKEAIANYKHK